MAVLMLEAIGDTLRRARTVRRRTLRDVSRRARVSLGYLSEVEGGRKEASSELLAAICEALDISLPDLLTDAADTITEAMATAMTTRGSVKRRPSMVAWATPIDRVTRAARFLLPRRSGTSM